MIRMIKEEAFMKKLLALLLTMGMLLSVLGCTPGGGETQSVETVGTTAPATDATEPEEFQLEVEGFQVGFCREIMNPTKPIPLSGYGNTANRILREIGDDITATAVAISDGEGNHVLLISTDLITASEGLFDAVKMVLNVKTGMPKDRIIITACHSHSAPDVASSLSEGYTEIVTQKIIEAAMNALADRKPAEMYTGSVETVNLNFVKHYSHVTEDGQTLVFGDNFGTQVLDETTKHATEVDPTMHLLRFTREGAEDVVVVNWRAHPHFTGGSSKYVLSSDYIATFRQALEDQTGTNVVYFQGACGNVNSSTRLAEERRTTDYRVFGALLAEHAIDGLENNMTKVETGRIQTKQIDFYGEINHTQNHLLAQASQVASIWASTNSWDACRPLMNQYGIRSPYHANAIKANYSRSKEDGRMTVSAVSIGEDFALVTFPGELFDTISVGVEEGSPYQSTMLLGYAIHHIGYLPSAIAFEYTSYETDITRFVAGTGELLQAEYINMLNELKNNG